LKVDGFTSDYDNIILLYLDNLVSYYQNLLDALYGASCFRPRSYNVQRSTGVASRQSI
jgi:hypothetical protein